MKPNGTTSPERDDAAALTLTQREAFDAGWREGEAFVRTLRADGPHLGHEHAATAFADTLGEIVCAGSSCDWNDEAQSRFEGFALCIGEVLFCCLVPPAGRRQDIEADDVTNRDGIQTREPSQNAAERRITAPAASIAARRFDCWSSNDGDSWYESPTDAQIIDDIFGCDLPKVGDEYAVVAGWRGVQARYRVTEVSPDGVVDADCISHPVENVPMQDICGTGSSSGTEPGEEQEHST